jgi:hypothetical protein
MTLACNSSKWSFSSAHYKSPNPVNNLMVKVMQNAAYLEITITVCERIVPEHQIWFLAL